MVAENGAKGKGGRPPKGPAQQVRDGIENAEACAIGVTQEVEAFADTDKDMDWWQDVVDAYARAIIANSSDPYARQAARHILAARQRIEGYETENEERVMVGIGEQNDRTRGHHHEAMPPAEELVRKERENSREAVAS